MKIIKILTFSFCIIIMLSHPIFAANRIEIMTTARSWLETGKNNANDTMDTGALRDSVSSLYNFLLVVATGVAVIVGASLGVKYMTAGVNEKVKVKESLIPYLISCVVVFGSMGIWKIAIEVVKVIN